MTFLSQWEEDRPKRQTTSPADRVVSSLIEQCYVNDWNLVLEAHPRSGKSEKVCVFGPAWWTKDHAWYKTVLLTHTQNLANKFVAGVTSLLKKYDFELEYERASEVKIKGTESLDPTFAGYGISGGFAGKGAHRLICDDLLKSGAEAMSAKTREAVTTKFVEGINRLEPNPRNGKPGCFTILQARLHPEDPAGWTQNLESPVVLAHFPATNDDGYSAFIRNGYTGETIHLGAYDHFCPRYPRTHLDQIRQIVPSYYWQAQWMQNANLGDQTYFDVDKMPKYQHSTVERCWIAVDAAQTATKGGSFTAFCCLGWDGVLLKVIDVRRGRWRQDEIGNQLCQFFEQQARNTGILSEAVIVERAAAGYGLIDQFSHKLPIIPLIPKGSKEDRAGAVCYLVNTGRVALPETGAFLNAFTSELRNFPLTAFADQVDSFVHALSYASRPSEFTPVPQEGVVVYDALKADRGRSSLSAWDDADAPAFDDGSDLVRQHIALRKSGWF